MAVIELKALSKSLGGRKILENVNLTVSKGEFYSILGPNGVGKTTLLRIIAGLLKPDSGRLRVEGSVGFVPQSDLLLPWLTLRENIELPLKLRRLEKREIDERVFRATYLVGLDGNLSLYPRQASGGTRRKAAIARALALGADILLLDEPFNGLDVSSLTSLRETLMSLKGGVTVVLVSHQVYEVAYLSDRVGLLTGRPAMIRVEEVLEGLPLEKKLLKINNLILGLPGDKEKE